MELAIQSQPRSQISRPGRGDRRSGVPASSARTLEQTPGEGGKPGDRPGADSASQRTRRERELLRGIGAGESHAFAALFAAYYDKLCYHARGLLDSAELAEEVVGDVFAHLWEQRRSLHVQRNLNGYLYVTVRRRSLKRLERLRLEQRWSEEARRGVRDDAMSQPRPSPEEELLGAELAVAIEQAINSLPYRSRLAYTLHRTQNRSYAEIADIMGISVRTVENNISRATRLLRERLAHWLT